MMRKILFCLLFPFLSGFALAHPVSIRSLDMVGRSDAVYLARVISVKEHRDGASDNQITFSITKTLRGPTLTLRQFSPMVGGVSATFLVLTGYEDFNPKVNSEWMLLHNPSGFKACVGWAMEGDCEWLPLTVGRDGDKITTEVGPIDKVSDYLEDHPYKR
jgi:hypothetical protein